MRQSMFRRILRSPFPLTTHSPPPPPPAHKNMSTTSSSLHVLSHDTLAKVRWYLGSSSSSVRRADAKSLEEMFQEYEEEDEEGILVRFSKFTRGMAGEDPEADPDDESDENRYDALKRRRGGGGAQMTSTTMQTSTSLPTSSGRNVAARANAEALTRKRKKPQVLREYPFIPEGRKAAAKLEEDMWALVKVLRYSKRSKLYTVEDIDDSADIKKEHSVAREQVIPLPGGDYFPAAYMVGDRVLAVFPSTTSFYPATVVKVNKRNSSGLGANKTSSNGINRSICDYTLRFDDDDEGSDGEVDVKKIKGELVIDEV